MPTLREVQREEHRKQLSALRVDFEALQQSHGILVSKLGMTRKLRKTGKVLNKKLKELERLEAELLGDA